MRTIPVISTPPRMVPTTLEMCAKLMILASDKRQSLLRTQYKKNYSIIKDKILAPNRPKPPQTILSLYNVDDIKGYLGTSTVCC